MRFMSTFINTRIRNNNNKEMIKGKIKQTIRNKYTLNYIKRQYIHRNTIENIVFVDRLLKMQNFINSFENVQVLNTSLTTACFHKVACSDKVY